MGEIGKTDSVLGFTVADLIKLGLQVVMLVIFLVRTDARISTQENLTKELNSRQTILFDFMRDSDAWHSAVLGTQFYQGKPLNNSFQMPFGIRVPPA